VFIERLWRSVKYECVYLKAYRKLPLRRDRRGVELSGRIWPGGSNEAVTIQ
jgi:hypothetical protein